MIASLRNNLFPGAGQWVFHNSKYKSWSFGSTQSCWSHAFNIDKIQEQMDKNRKHDAITAMGLAMISQSNIKTKHTFAK